MRQQFDDGRDPRPAHGGAQTYHGRVVPGYAPEMDGEPDPGEIVWAWVAYEEDPNVGKDRPLVVIGRAADGSGAMVAMLLSSQDHEGDDDWVLLGAGAWDRDRRESWVRVDRMLAVPANGIRREGAVLQRDRYDRLLRDIVAELRD